MKFFSKTRCLATLPLIVLAGGIAFAGSMFNKSLQRAVTTETQSVIGWNAAETFKGTQVFTAPTANRTWTWPDATGTVALTNSVLAPASLDVPGATTLDGAVTLGDAAADIVTVSGTVAGASPLVFEGATADAFETTIAFADPTADRTATFPDLTGTVQLSGNPISGTTLTKTTGGFTVGDRETLVLHSSFVGVIEWIAPAACKVINAVERHVTVCDAADTLTIEKVPSGTAPGSGTVCLADNLTLNSTANTNATVAGHGTLGTASLAAGNGLALKYVSGDGTNWDGLLTVTVEWL